MLTTVPRRSATGDFFEHRREWSRWKHFVEEGYLPMFGRILGRDGGRVNWIDGFAGPGEYGDGASGSPVIAARVSQTLSERGDRRSVLRCFNYEKDSGLYAGLCRATEEFDPHLIVNRNESFGPEVARGVTDEIGREPALFFLDPFGPDGLPWETLRVLGERHRLLKTEIMMNFSVPKLDQHMGWIDSDGQKARTAFLELVKRVWPTDDDSWLHIVTNTRDPLKRYDLLTRRYMDALEQQFGFFVVRFPVRTLETGALKYYLLHATRSRTALLLVWQVYYSAHRRYQEAVREHLEGPPGPRQMSLLPAMSEEEREASLLSFLEHDVWEAGRRYGRISIHDLQWVLMRRYFGKVAQKHFEAVCRGLIERRAIDRPQGPRGIGWKEPLRFVA